MFPSSGGGEVLQLMSISDPPFCLYSSQSAYPLLPAMACERWTGMVNRETARPPFACRVLCRDVDRLGSLVTAMKKEGHHRAGGTIMVR